jgi:hypothetical protein
VERDVHAAVRAVGLRVDVVVVLRAGDVGGDEHAAELVGHRLARDDVDVHGDDRRALRRQPAARGQADPAGRTGHDRDPILQSPHPTLLPAASRRH